MDAAPTPSFQAHTVPCTMEGGGSIFYYETQRTDLSQMEACRGGSKVRGDVCRRKKKMTDLLSEWIFTWLAEGIGDFLSESLVIF